MKIARVLPVALAASLPLAVASAQDLGKVTLFGQQYAVQRFNYLEEVTFPDPLDPTFNVGIAEVEGFTFFGKDRFIMSSDAMDEVWATYKNFIVEGRFETDDAGAITGMTYVRTIVTIGPEPAPGGYDLDPSGVTFNTGPNGLAAGGDLLVSCVEDSIGERIRGFDFATGDQFEWPVGSGCLTQENGTFCGISVIENNLDAEDLVYVPTRDLIYTVDQGNPPDASHEVEIYTTDGVNVGNFPIGPEVVPGAGESKGITYLPDVDTYPELFRGKGGIVIVALDDKGPGLQAFDLDGKLVANEPLVVKGQVIVDPDSQLQSPLQLESVGTDPATGRLFLINQSSGFADAFIYVLTPVGAGCAADFNGDGTVNSTDVSDFINQWFQDQVDGTLVTDWDGNGVINSTDVSDFINAWFEDTTVGCG
jgi:hypothetical protein